jgi:hypothetical protein
LIIAEQWKVNVAWPHEAELLLEPALSGGRIEQVIATNDLIDRLIIVVDDDG